MVRRWPSARWSGSASWFMFEMSRTVVWKRWAISVRVSPRCTWYTTGGAVVVRGRTLRMGRDPVEPLGVTEDRPEGLPVRGAAPVRLGDRER